jgi:hypothetical protein
MFSVRIGKKILKKVLTLPPPFPEYLTPSHLFGSSHCQAEASNALNNQRPKEEFFNF